MDESLTSFLKSFNSLAQLASEQQSASDGVPLRQVLADYLGFEPHNVPIVAEPFSPHRLADVNIVLDEISSLDPESRVIGLSGQERHHMEFADMLTPAGYQVNVGEPSYTSQAVGPGKQQRFLSFGIFLFKYQDRPIAVALRPANERFGRMESTLEFLAAQTETSDALIKEFRERLRKTSIFRGHVISFKNSDFGDSNAGVTFHHRAQLSAEQLILPDGVRERITDQILGIGLNREFLSSHGVHLKRGVLLYGPPGTGKTHTVRYLTSAAKDHTVILLNGNTLSLVSEAASMARALQPALVVLEDCDLIAEDRHFGHGPQPLLFEVLDSMDGLDADADVAFLLTTNRVESLEKALVQRPGRIDLAVEIPRPDFEGRVELLRLYTSQISADEQTLRKVSELIEGTTASFVKELVRRAVLLAAVQNTEPGSQELFQAATELMSDQAALTRNLLGGTSDPESYDLDGSGEEVSFGFFPGVEIPSAHYPMDDDAGQEDPNSSDDR